MTGNEECSLGHWCPNRFHWDAGESVCKPDYAACQLFSITTNAIITGVGGSQCKQEPYTNDWFSRVSLDYTDPDNACFDFDGSSPTRACVYRTIYDNIKYGEMTTISVLDTQGNVVN